MVLRPAFGAAASGGGSGADGADGASAYEVAVAQGFVGNEAAWLASLEGADGADGTQGPQGIQGVKGDTGDTGPAGPGRAVQLHCGRSSGLTKNGTGTYIIACTVEEIDESDSLATLSNSVFTAPSNGTVDVTFTMQLADNTAGGDPSNTATLRIVAGGSIPAIATFQAGSAGEQSVTVCAVESMTSGQVLYADITGLIATDSLTINRASYVIRFYPD